MGEWAGETVGPDVWETCRELIPAGSVFAFLAEHRGVLFPAVLFEDMYPSSNGRPSMPPQILAAAITVPAGFVHRVGRCEGPLHQTVALTRHRMRRGS